MACFWEILQWVSSDFSAELSLASQVEANIDEQVPGTL
jgi:hypothetical protein